MRMGIPAMFHHVLTGWATSVVILCASSAAMASGYSMGLMQTIGHDGALDAIRNPALLAFHTAPNSIGFIADAAVYAPHFSSFGASSGQFGSNLASARLHETQPFAMNAALAYCRSVKKGTLGFAAAPADEATASASHYDRSFDKIDTASAFYMSQRGHNRQIGSRIAISYGLPLTDGHALGLRCDVGYGLTRDRFINAAASLSTFNYHHRANKRIDEISASLAIGYLFHSLDTTAGLILTTGRFAWRNFTLHYGHMDLVTPKYWYGKVREPFSFSYDRGVTFTGGGYRKFASFIAIGLEGEFEIPYSANRKELRYDEFTSFFAVTQNLQYRRNGSFGFKAGIEFLPNGPVVIALGAGYLSERQRMSGNFFSQQTSSERVSGSLGVDVTAFSRILLFLGARIEHTRQRVAATTMGATPDVLSLDGIRKTTAIHTYLGLSSDW